MVSAIVSLLGTSAGGAILKLAHAWIESRSVAKQEQLQRDHEQRLADKKQLLKFQEILNETAGEPKKLKNDSQFTFKLFGKEFGYTRKYEKEAITSIPARLHRSITVWMLAFTYCSVLWLFADNPGRVIWTFNPAAEPSSYSILFGLLDWSVASQEIVALTTGGVAYLMCYPLVFVISAWITGLPLSALKRK